jgi:DinB superfamily
LAKKWEAFEKARHEFLIQLAEFNTSNFNKQPEDGGWSASQVVEHILSSETGTLGYMMKKSSSGWETLEVTGEEQSNNSKALNDRLSSDMRIAAPAVLPQPTNAYNQEQLKDQWQQLRDKYQDFLNNIEERHYDKLVFKQPVAGMLNVVQAIEFLTLHLKHHIPQLHRIQGSMV